MSAKNIVLLAVAWAICSVSTVEAQTLFGTRLGVYVDQEDLFIGGELLTPLSGSYYLNPNVEYVFVDRAHQATFNFDFHYDFASSGPTTFWLGAGLGILYVNREGPAGSDADVGANLLFGAAFLRGADLVPYVQGKVIVADDSEFVLGFGLRF